MPADDSKARVPIGPVGRYVVGNLERLRSDRGLTYRQLSDRLTQIGRPIPTLGLSRIESGNRRVDADDLVALCIALEVSPPQMLLPPDPGGPDDEVELTDKVRLSGYAGRQWAAARSPIPAVDAISWDRPAFMVQMREKQLEEMRQQLNYFDAAERSRLDREAEAQDGAGDGSEAE